MFQGSPSRFSRGPSIFPWGKKARPAFWLISKGPNGQNKEKAARGGETMFGGTLGLTNMVVCCTASRHKEWAKHICIPFCV